MTISVSVNLKSCVIYKRRHKLFGSGGDYLSNPLPRGLVRLQDS